MWNILEHQDDKGREQHARTKDYNLSHPSWSSTEEINGNCTALTREVGPFEKMKRGKCTELRGGTEITRANERR